MLSGTIYWRRSKSYLLHREVGSCCIMRPLATRSSNVDFPALSNPIISSLALVFQPKNKRFNSNIDAYYIHSTRLISFLSVARPFCRILTSLSYSCFVWLILYYDWTLQFLYLHFVQIYISKALIYKHLKIVCEAGQHVSLDSRSHVYKLHVICMYVCTI